MDRFSVRFIPTGVGKTWSQWAYSAGLPVHPHGRGENFQPYLDRLQQVRFIPTGVGKTLGCTP